MEEARQSQLVGRMIRAARLDRTLYTEVAADASATRQALTVVILSAVASGIASFLSTLLLLSDFGSGVLGLILATLLVILGWVVWTGVAWFVGTRMIGTGTQDIEFLPVARSLGFAQAPSVVSAITFIPILGFIILLGVWLWLLATGFFAIRGSMRLTDGQAIATIIIGFIAYIIVAFVLMVVSAALVGVSNVL